MAQHVEDSGEFDSAIRVVEELRGWYESPLPEPNDGQDAHPDAMDAPSFGQEYARAAARRRLDEQAERLFPTW